MDRESVYTLSIGLTSTGRDGDDDSQARSRTQQQLIDFLLEFRIENQFIYR
jgi:hypothetical protein